MPVRKNIEPISYATDGYNGDLYSWKLYNTSSSTLVNFFSPINLGTDTAWANTKVYTLTSSNNKNIFTARDLWGTGGLLDDYGYGNASYGDGSVSKEYIRLTSSTYPRLTRVSASVIFTLPVSEITQKYYLPVRKKTETIYATSNGYEGTLYSLQIFQGNGSGISVYRGYTDTLRIYSDTTWDEAIVYELNSNNNLYYPKNLFGATNSVFADLGYPNAVYNLSASTDSHSCMVSNGGTNAHLSLSSTDTVTLPVTETTEKLYIPVRKKNGTTKYYI